MRAETMSKLLKIKILIKDRHEAESREAKEALEIERQRLKVMQESISRAANELKERQLECHISVREYDMHLKSCSDLQRAIADQNQAVEHRRTEYKEKKTCLIEANKGKKIIESLREKMKSEIHFKKGRLEQKEIDSFAIRSKRFRDE